MKQAAHAWVALRAFKLLDDSGEAPKLAELLAYYLGDVWEGAWLPDTLIGDMQYGHIFKMARKPPLLDDDVTGNPRFRASYDELKKRLIGKRLCLEWARDATCLGSGYRVHREKGGHLPNRVIAIAQSIGDMLKMSDYPITFYARGQKPKEYQRSLDEESLKALSGSPNFGARQIAVMFFLLAHYITDAHMPLHCDMRDYGSDRRDPRIPRGLHPSTEEKWETYFPDKSILTLHSYAPQSVAKAVADLPPGSPIRVGQPGPYDLANISIKGTKGDEWEEMVNVARVSYAVSEKWIATRHDSADDMIRADRAMFEDVTNRIFADAVASVTRLWLKAWNRFAKSDASQKQDSSAGI